MGAACCLVNSCFLSLGRNLSSDEPFSAGGKKKERPGLSYLEGHAASGVKGKGRVSTQV